MSVADLKVLLANENLKLETYVNLQTAERSKIATNKALDRLKFAYTNQQAIVQELKTVISNKLKRGEASDAQRRLPNFDRNEANRGVVWRKVREIKIPKEQKRKGLI